MSVRRLLLCSLLLLSSVVVQARSDEIPGGEVLVPPGEAGPSGVALPPDAPSGPEVVRRVNARDDGASVVRTLVMELTDKRGRSRRRVTRFWRRDFDGERRSVLFFEEPTNVKGTAFLTWDFAEGERDDALWLYLPALRKSRRIAASDRGQSFLGTDFSYEDIKKETRLGLEDYRWRTVGSDEVDGHPCWVLEAVPVDEETASELGYGRLLVRIDAAIWIPRLSEYWTLAGEPLKTVELGEIRKVQGVWTPHRVVARNHRTGHSTRFEFSDVDYQDEIPEDLFTERALRRGPRYAGR